jgi:hypothetical protein
VNAAGQVHAITSRFRDALSYEVAVQTAAAWAWRPQAPASPGAAPAQLPKPGLRMIRAKEPSIAKIWVVVLAITVLRTG